MERPESQHWYIILISFCPTQLASVVITIAPLLCNVLKPVCLDWSAEDDYSYLIYFYLLAIIVNVGDPGAAIWLLISKGMITGLIIDTFKLVSFSLDIYHCPFNALLNITLRMRTFSEKFNVAIQYLYRFGWSSGPLPLHQYPNHPISCIVMIPSGQTSRPCPFRQT